MKRSTWLILFILTINLALAQNIYQQDSLELELNVDSSFDLISEKKSATIREVTTELLLFPQESFRQKILDLETTGKQELSQITFKWRNPPLSKQEYGYSAKIKTFNKRNQVNKKIPYPLNDIKGYEQYTLPTSKIDSDDPAIISKARELTQGEDDLFKVVFKLSDWVSENIDYDLNELTTDVAQKASWVLDNRQGVCDEMTSLFVAMARSLGIPARFVSGISYTENQDVLDALGKNWAGHGWAEVYFPEIGWVSFDITFDEFGYIDVTHIKLREGLDPDEPATKFSWLSEGVELVTKDLNLDVKILDKGGFIPEDIQLQGEILANALDFGSYNLVKGIVKNTANNYAVTTLTLAIPKEVEIIGKNKRKLLLLPKEVRETFWIVKIKDSLDPNFFYKFPLVIYSEKNTTVENEFEAKKGETIYTRKEIEALTIEDEEKSYTHKITIDCQYPQNIMPDTETKVSCIIKNNGDKKLLDLDYCLDNVCEKITLLPNQENSQEIKFVKSTPGWHNIVVSAQNDIIEKKHSLTFKVVDKAKVKANVVAPETINFGEDITLSLNVDKDSFVTPNKVVVTLKGLGIEQKWEIEELITLQKLTTTFPGDRLNFKNKLVLTINWENANQLYQQEIVIDGKANSFPDRLKMVINYILLLFN